MTKWQRKKSQVKMEFSGRIWTYIRNTFTVIGFATFLSLVLNIDMVQHWLAQPKLDVKVLQWYFRRETTSFSGNTPLADKLEITLNIEPRVRFHVGPFPVNQVQSIGVRKGTWFGAYELDREVPFNVKDEPITLKLSVYDIPIEGPHSKGVEIKVVDRWGNVSIAPIENAF